MDTKGYRHIPQSLFDAITFLAQALPKPLGSRIGVNFPYFCELSRD
jgi:hypothetical protein